MHSPPQSLVITAGEPAGIGPDLIVQMALNQQLKGHLILGDLNVLTDRASAAGVMLPFARWSGEKLDSQNKIWVEHLACDKAVIPGVLNADNAAHVLSMLRRAHEHAISGFVQGIVTAPISKSIINQAGIAFSGHTEFFQALSGVDRVVMMLMSRQLKVALVTTHIPISMVSQTIDQALLERVITIVRRSLKAQFGLGQPSIGLLGLNPHAGESGYIGREEMDVLQPVVDRCLARGWSISQPLSADTAFVPEHLTPFDIMLAMYHDQGLIPIKQTGFGEIANVTLGLPYIRTSVDHGTALALAGTQQGSSASFVFAIQTAGQMIRCAREESQS